MWPVDTVDRADCYIVQKERLLFKKYKEHEKTDLLDCKKKGLMGRIRSNNV